MPKASSLVPRQPPEEGGTAFLLPLPRVVLRNQAAHVIREAILDGHLALGSPLVEAQIARQMGTSRAPLREALRTLEQEGLVVSAEHRGVTVATLGDKDIEDIYYHRAALECFAIRRVCLQGDAAVLANDMTERIRRIQEAATAKDLGRAQREDIALHEAIIRASGQSRLLRAWEQNLGQVRLALTALSQHPGYPGLHLMPVRHTPILSALQEGDAARAEAEVYEHVVGLTVMTIQRASDERSA